jgi:ATP-dependent DNA helicase RecQ
VECLSELAVAERVRETVFGFRDWRGEQARVLQSLLNGKSCLTVMPTGMGKSLCYQIPAAAAEDGEGVMGGGFVLVVSPLIALMKDQVDSARRKGLRAAAIHSAMPREERERILSWLKAGKNTSSPRQGSIQLLYATPERFRQEPFWEAISAAADNGLPLKLLAIDEAHCISTWGHDFRLDYSRLGERRARLGNPLTLALTATATKETQSDILRELGMRDAETHVSSVWRPNLAIEVLETGGLDEKIRAFVLSRHLNPGPAIVYFALIQTLKKFSEEISRLGFVHSVYHSQIGDGNRRREQESFLGGDTDLMLATPAFGLGIDKADVRLLVHAEMPGSMEAYYQEIGRAGRDGKNSACVALYDRDDVTIQADFVKWSTPDPGFIQSVHNLISRNEMRARQEGFDYLRSQMNFYNRRDFRVETSVGLLERWGALEGREPREWKAIGEVPTEYLDPERYKKSLRHREEKLQRLVDFFERSPEDLAGVSGCRLVEVARSFGEILNDKRCGICDACRAVA